MHLQSQKENLICLLVQDLYLYKVGIANKNPVKKSDLLHRFKNHGWSEDRIWDFANGNLVQDVEKEFSHFLRKELGIHSALKRGTLFYQGETETFPIKSISIELVLQIIDGILQNSDEFKDAYTVRNS